MTLQQKLILAFGGIPVFRAKVILTDEENKLWDKIHILGDSSLQKIGGDWYVIGLLIDKKGNMKSLYSNSEYKVDPNTLAINLNDVHDVDETLIFVSITDDSKGADILSHNYSGEHIKKDFWNPTFYMYMLNMTLYSYVVIGKGNQNMIFDTTHNAGKRVKVIGVMK